MIRRGKAHDDVRDDRVAGSGDIQEWVLGLPWVVERSPSANSHMRVFAVDCKPLRRRQVWLITGYSATPREGSDVAVVMPRFAPEVAQAARWEVHAEASLPAGHVLVSLGPNAPRRPRDIEAFLLAAYSYAIG
jgi:hypothetical protein